MKILFITAETPIFPGGGIGVYFHYVVPALEAAGHEVHLLTWRHREAFVAPQSLAPFHPDRVHIEVFSVVEAMRANAPRSYCEILSHLLSERVIALADRWQIDVIESVDFHAPGLIAFQKLQTSKAGARRLLATFNHGLHEVITEANQTRPTPDDQAGIVAERKIMRVSDLVIAPSQAASRMCRNIGVTAPISIVREPYVFRGSAGPDAAPTHNIQFQGRLSVQKGIDRLSLVANAINAVVPVGRIDLIGSSKPMAFTGQTAIDFLRQRLDRGLAERIVHHEELPRAAVLKLLESGAFGPHLGTNETFSYACVEAIDAGLIPVVHNGNAMFEFLPEDLAGIALDARMQSVREIQRKIETMLRDSQSIRERIRAHCQATLAPATIAAKLADTYAQALDRKIGRSSHPSAQPPVGVSDISVLVPVVDLRPNALATTLASVAAQSAGQPRVVLCLDGLDMAFGPQVRAALNRLTDLRIIPQIRAGLPALLNTLAEECATELALVLKPGQSLAPTALQSMIAAWSARNMPADALIVPEPVSQRQDPQAHQLLAEPAARRLDELRGQAALIRTALLRSIGFDSTRRNGERVDWAFWLAFDANGHRAITLPEADLITCAEVSGMQDALSEAAQIGTQLLVRDVLAADPVPGAE